jgi:hypothetical protein
MTTSPCSAFAALCLVCSTPAVLAVPGNGNSNNIEPLIPVGSLDAYPVLVQTGTHPTLTWDIQYPESVLDIVTIDPGGTVTPSVDLCMEVRVLGASYQIGWDRRGKPVWGYVQAAVKSDGDSSFTQFFYDTQDDVKPSYTYYTREVRAARPIDFRARCYNGNYWLPWRTTEATTPNVVALTNGDTPPSTVPAFQQGNIESFLEPYLDGGGKVSIGPKDVIFLIELGQTNTNASGFDLQDLVILATFDYCKNNNGHGNNVDGVDTSNPGNAPFIDQDTDPNVDDEGSGGGAYPSYGN